MQRRMVVEGWRVCGACMCVCVCVRACVCVCVRVRASAQGHVCRTYLSSLIALHLHQLVNRATIRL